MQTLLEPTSDNIDMVATTPGTHYFSVSPVRVQLIRSCLYKAVSNGVGHQCHTSYNDSKQQLRVVISD
jgi:hypothetical protein